MHNIKYYTNGDSFPWEKDGDPKEVKNVKEADVAIIYGGDGSILRTIPVLADNNALDVPILGVNTGHVGFLSNDITREEAYKFLLNPSWRNVERRNLLGIRLENKTICALNDVVIQPTKRGVLFETKVTVSPEVLSYKGDGIIISTSSGSTAYNLSAGGPLICPESKVFCVTPICPFSLAGRPLILSIAYTLLINTDVEAEITVDGASVYVGKLENVSIFVSATTLGLIKFNSFFSSIQEKLGWNRSIK